MHNVLSAPMLRACRYCETSRQHGRSNCWACGQAVVVGTAPSQEMREEAELAHRKREKGLTLQESQAMVDERVLAGIAKGMRPLSDFTHEQIGLICGVNQCAVKFSLVRLAKRRVVVRAGFVVLNNKRKREIWQYVPEDLAFLFDGNLNDETTRRLDLEEVSDAAKVSPSIDADEEDDYGDLSEVGDSAEATCST